MTLPATIVGGSEKDTFAVEFVPKTVGDHKVHWSNNQSIDQSINKSILQVHVRFAGADVEGSPFTCRVYDARCIRVSDIPAGVLGKNVTFVVDASEAGVGNLVRLID